MYITGDILRYYEKDIACTVIEIVYLYSPEWIIGIQKLISNKQINKQINLINQLKENHF